MSFIRNKEDLENLRYSCRIVASIFAHIEKNYLKPGTDASVINQFIADFAAKYNAVPSFLGYKKYPYNCNFSINHEVTHAFPSPGRKVPENGVLKIDIGVKYKGMISDMCMTFILGSVTPEARRLSEVCKEALWSGIHAVKAGVKLGDVGYAIDQHAKKHKFGNVRVLGGHGVGYELHDDPWIAHYGKPGRGTKLLAGQAITIEPMFNLGGHDVDFSDTDGWTVTTHDGSISAQWEHTLLVTESGCDVLTAIEESEILA